MRPINPLIPGAWLALCVCLTLLAACNDVPSPAPMPKTRPCSVPIPATNPMNSIARSPKPSGSTSATAQAKQPAAGEDLAAQVYDLAGISTFAAKHRFVTLPGVVLRPRSDCLDAKDPCSIRKEIRLDHPELLADHPTRLTLIWSADKAGFSDLEASISANGKQDLRQADWLRPTAGSVAGRRLMLVVPAPYVRRNGGLCVDIHVATRIAGKNAKARPYLDGLEIEVLP